jgi:hypothetical protein
LGEIQFALKYSVLEPTDAVDGIYELIFHANGKLTADWDGNIEVDLFRRETDYLGRRVS